jgi:hypothetical protein
MNQEHPLKDLVGGEAFLREFRQEGRRVFVLMALIDVPDSFQHDSESFYPIIGCEQESETYKTNEYQDLSSGNYLHLVVDINNPRQSDEKTQGRGLSDIVCLPIWKLFNRSAVSSEKPDEE